MVSMLRLEMYHNHCYCRQKYTISHKKQSRKLADAHVNFEWPARVKRTFRPHTLCFLSVRNSFQRKDMPLSPLQQRAKFPFVNHYPVFYVLAQAELLGICQILAHTKLTASSPSLAERAIDVSLD